MKIIIETVQNGVVIRTTESGGEPHEELSYAFDTDSNFGDEDRDKQAHALWQVLELLGWVGSKHDAKRIYITVEPGSNYEEEANANA